MTFSFWLFYWFFFISPISLQRISFFHLVHKNLSQLGGTFVLTAALNSSSDNPNTYVIPALHLLIVPYYTS